MAAGGLSSSVDMSLDEIVKKNRGTMRSRGRRGRGRTGGLRGFWAPNNRRGRNLRYSRRPFGVGKGGRRQLPDIWDKGSLLEKSNSLLSSSTKDVIISSNRLLVTNLNFTVIDNDVKELFSTCGQLKKAVINYDNTGHSNGTAEVVYFDRGSAQKAYNSFNGVCLDGRPLKIQYLDAPDAARTTVSRLTLPPTARPRRGFGLGGGRGSAVPGRGVGRGSRRGRGRASAGRNPKSAAALDQEMIDYQNNEVEMK